MPFILHNNVMFLCPEIFLNSEIAVFFFGVSVETVRLRPGLGAASSRHVSFLVDFFIRMKYNFYLSSFRMTVLQNHCTPRDIHYFLQTRLGNPSSFHLFSSLIYFTLPESPFFCWQFSLLYFAMTFHCKLLGLCYSQFEIYLEQYFFCGFSALLGAQ